MKSAGAAPRRERGFTLIEMLIVVAIIAVLVAVSIPLVQNSLEGAREATDMANERAAKAEATILLLTDGFQSEYYIYDARSGKLHNAYDGADTAPYGKCSDHKDAVLWVWPGEDGVVDIGWVGSTETKYETHLYPVS